MQSGAVVQQRAKSTAFFLESGAYDLLVTLHLPVGHQDIRGWVVLLPPFGEELNICRGMITRTAVRLATNGYAVVIPDLAATGDSTGSLEEIRLSQWQADMRRTIVWVSKQADAPITLWGIRFGGLLLNLLEGEDFALVTNIVLWQAIASGRQFWRQLTREGVASDTGFSRKPDSAGGIFELAGYRVHREFAEELQSQVLSLKAPMPNVKLWFLELPWSEASIESPPRLQATIDTLVSQGLEPRVISVKGTAFWSHHEAPHSEEFIDQFLALLESEVSERGGYTRERPSNSLLSLVNRFGEHYLRIASGDNELAAIAHFPSGKESSTGVVIIVGGPQYRVGAHRLFVQLARHLANEGYPVLRFDFAGMGDSTGSPKVFSERASDISAAIQTLRECYPGIQSVSLWGLCDGATAAILHAGEQKDGVQQVIAVNPWIDSYRGDRQTNRIYYAMKLRGRIQSSSMNNVLKKIANSALNLLDLIIFGYGNHKAPTADRVSKALEKIGRSVVLICGTLDQTAMEFHSALRSFSISERGEKIVGREVIIDYADHTFTVFERRKKLIEKTVIIFDGPLE